MMKRQTRTILSALSRSKHLTIASYASSTVRSPLPPAMSFAGSEGSSSPAKLKVSSKERGGRRRRESDLTEEALARRMKRRKERSSVTALSGGALFEGKYKNN
ncbi:hypothetical protein DL98DRAFT_171254 [Cadophora sp. DSE1049]|nr:hypothetical protein DL98DRAFT_171254 [Cadophora sp. DSE1049]